MKIILPVQGLTQRRTARYALLVTLALALMVSLASMVAPKADAAGFFHYRACEPGRAGMGSLVPYASAPAPVGVQNWDCGGGPSGPLPSTPSGMAFRWITTSHAPQWAHAGVYLAAPADRPLDIWMATAREYYNNGGQFFGGFTQSCTSPPINGCNAAVGTTPWAAGTIGDVAYNNNGSKVWHIYAQCLAAGGCAYSASPQALVVLHNVVVAIRDLASIANTGIGGSILDGGNGGWKTGYGENGAASGDYTASHSYAQGGSGIEGVNVYWRGAWNAHNYNGCSYTGYGHDVDSYQNIVPCPSTMGETRTLSVDGLADGDQTLIFGSRDATLDESLNTSRTIKVDNTPPPSPTAVQTTTASVGTEWSNRTARTFSLLAPETGAGSPNVGAVRTLERQTGVSTWAQVGGSVTDGWDSSAGTKNHSQSLEGQASGVYRSCVSVRDQATNHNSNSKICTATHRHDVSAPETTVRGAGDSNIDGKEIVANQATLNLTGDDQAALSGANRIEWQIDGQVGGATWTPGGLHPAGSAESYNGTTRITEHATVSGNGLHQVRVRTVDNAGNVSPERTVSFTLTAPQTPTVDIGNPDADGNPTVGSTLTCNAGTVSEGSIVSYRWLRDADPIEGANGQQYVVVEADRGKTLFCMVRIQNEAGVYEYPSNGIHIPGDQINGGPGGGSDVVEICRRNDVNGTTKLTAGFEGSVSAKKIKKRGKKSKSRAKKKAAPAAKLSSAATVNYNGTARITGRLLDAHGKPLADRTLVLLADSLQQGSQRTDVGGTRTRADGTYILQTPRLPSSKLFLGVRNCDGKFVAEQRLTLNTRAGLKLNKPRSIARNGRTIRYSGSIASKPLPRYGVKVSIRFRLPGGRWRKFEDARAKGAKGAFKFKRKFTGLVRKSGGGRSCSKVELQAVVSRTDDYPYLGAASKAVKQRWCA